MQRTHNLRMIPAGGLLRILAVFAVIGAFFLSPTLRGESAAQAEPLQIAFPGAEGYGRFAQGGRGGRIMAVTTLADSGPGSLRNCIEFKGPRICVFRVAGVIRFEKKRPVIYNPYITIAGETAPGGGIIVTHSGGKDGLTPLVIKDTHDVVIRHIRVRPDRLSEQRGSNDAFTIENSARVILDHVSGSWAQDELYDGHGDNTLITVSRSIFAEGLKNHDKCALLNSDPRGPQRISFLQNLCAHNGDRNPDINAPPGSCVEVVNNVFYNASTEFAEVWESNGGGPVSIVGNHFRSGPNTPAGTAAIRRGRIGSKGPSEIYQQDNLLDGDLTLVSLNAQSSLVDEPACPLTIDPLPADDVLPEVLRSSGAHPRDGVDLRIIEEVQTRTGAIVDQPGDIIPIAEATAPSDEDGDGMSDEWEISRGIDPQVFNPWADFDENGWANIEEYLDYRHRLLIGDDAQP